MAQDAPATGTEAIAPPKFFRLHVQNLGEEMTSETLLELFKPYGTVKGGEVKTTPDGKCKGFGFVTMSSEEEATKAIAEVNGTQHGEKAIIVFLAPGNKEKGKGEAKGKGKGKGKDTTKGKGKGKNTAPPTYQDPFAMYPNPYGLDPMQAYAAQMQQMQMMQQVYMTQAYQALQMQMAGYAGQADAQPEASNDKGKERKGKGKGKGKSAKVDGTFSGRLKSLNLKEDRGFGFIECAETMAAYSRDVFISREFVPEGAEIGDQVQFNVTLSDKGHPRAFNVAKK